MAYDSFSLLITSHVIYWQFSFFVCHFSVAISARYVTNYLFHVQWRKLALIFLYFSFPFIEAALHFMFRVMFCLNSSIPVLLYINPFYFLNVLMNSSNPSFPTSYKWIHLFFQWIHLLHDFIYTIYEFNYLWFTLDSYSMWIHLFASTHNFFDSFFLSTFQRCLTWMIVHTKRVVLQKMMPTMITYTSDYWFWWIWFI